MFKKIIKDLIVLFLSMMFCQKVSMDSEVTDLPQWL